jgi:hypothetical protein
VNLVKHSIVLELTPIGPFCGQFWGKGGNFLDEFIIVENENKFPFLAFKNEHQKNLHENGEWKGALREGGGNHHPFGKKGAAAIFCGIPSKGAAGGFRGHCKIYSFIQLHSACTFLSLHFHLSFYFNVEIKSTQKCLEFIQKLFKNGKE